jgi:hypothetical protein
MRRFISGFEVRIFRVKTRDYHHPAYLLNHVILNIVWKTAFAFVLECYSVDNEQLLSEQNVPRYVILRVKKPFISVRCVAVLIRYEIHLSIVGLIAR